MMVARWSIDAKFGHKQAVIDSMKRWLQEIGPRAGGDAQRTRLLTGSVGALEATVVTEHVIDPASRPAMPALPRRSRPTGHASPPSTTRWRRSRLHRWWSSIARDHRRPAGRQVAAQLPVASERARRPAGQARAQRRGARRVQARRGTGGQCLRAGTVAREGEEPRVGVRDPMRHPLHRRSSSARRARRYPAAAHTVAVVAWRRLRFAYLGLGTAPYNSQSA